MPTLHNIQLLRAVAVLLVAAFHLEVYLVWLSPYGERWLRPFAYSGVDLFFVISGFINYYVRFGHDGSRRYPLRFLLKRAIRIFPNYWLFLTLTLPLVLYAGMHPMPEAVRYAESYLLFYPLRLVEHILLPGWTLNYEWLFYLAFAALLLFPRALWWIVGGYALANIAAQNVMQHWAVSRFWEFALAPYFLQFIAGMAVAEAAHRRIMPCPRAAIFIGLGFFALAWWMQVAIYPETFANPFHRDLRATLYLLAYTPVLYGLVALEQAGRYRCDNRLLLHLGDASFTLYLLFMPYFYACYLLWKHLIGDYGPLWLATFVFAPLVTLSYLAVGSLHYRFVERPMIRWLKHRLIR